jgi:hypothetical protein
MKKDLAPQLFLANPGKKILGLANMGFSSCPFSLFIYKLVFLFFVQDFFLF